MAFWGQTEFKGSSVGSGHFQSYSEVASSNSFDCVIPYHKNRKTIKYLKSLIHRTLLNETKSRGWGPYANISPVSASRPGENIWRRSFIYVLHVLSSPNLMGSLDLCMDLK